LRKEQQDKRIDRVDEQGSGEIPGIEEQLKALIDAAIKASPLVRAAPRGGFIACAGSSGLIPESRGARFPKNMFALAPELYLIDDRAVCGRPPSAKTWGSRLSFSD
jgi:hypothetical protein